MKLEIGHLASYLPYGLNCVSNITGTGNKKGVITGIEPYNDENFKVLLKNYPVEYMLSCNCLPVLHPLEDFAKYIDILDEFSDCELEKFNLSFFSTLGRPGDCYNSVSYLQANLMFEHHIDLFGLIYEGLAIDINTINVSQ